MTLKLSDKLRKNLEFAITELDGIDGYKDEIRGYKREIKRLQDCSSPILREKVATLEERLKRVEALYEKEVKAHMDKSDEYDILFEKCELLEAKLKERG